MKQIKNKILAVMLVSAFILNFMLPVLIDTAVVLAADATDYDFTNELKADRVGIGFTWTAATRTLTITGIKNSEALVKLPADSTIDIQGNIVNTVKGVSAVGALTIKGNDVATLSVVKCDNRYQSYQYTSISAGSVLKIESGRIKINAAISNSSTSDYNYAGIFAKEVIINNGSIDISMVGSIIGDYITLNAIATDKLTINGGNINLNSTHDAMHGQNYSTMQAEINGGNIIAESISGYGIAGIVKINGGNVTTKVTRGNHGAFDRVPSVNPIITWKVTYNYKNDSLKEEREADITDIYNIYQCGMVKLFGDSNEIITTNIHNATDYDFTDELEADRVGIGFTWTAATKTLTITGIKNDEALIKLPTDSTIDIQGNIINTVKGVSTVGALTIKGNDVATLSVVKCDNKYQSYQYTSIGVGSVLKIESGRIKINAIISNSSTIDYNYAGIFAKEIIINNGSVDISIVDSIIGADITLNAIDTNKLTINGGNINLNSTHDAMRGKSYGTMQAEINGGNITAESIYGYGIAGIVKINGGNVTAKVTRGNRGAFDRVPSVNPIITWKVTYNYKDDSLKEERKADITDIYNIYQCGMVKLISNVPATGITEVTGEDEIGIGEKTTFVATLKPSYSTSIVTWSSSDENIAKVAENGEITGIGLGTATITATANGFSASKDINVKCKITLDPNGVEGVEKNTVYTDITGKLEELPTLSDNANIFNKWVDENGNEVTTDTIFSTNATIYADWTAKPILVGEQKNIAKYGETTIVNYDVTADFGGTYTVKVENLPEGVTLINDNISLDASENGKYIGTIKLSVSNMVNAGQITNLKMYVNNKNTSNNFSLEINKAESTINTKPQVKNIVYTGIEQALIEKGTTSTGTMKYSVNGKTFTNDIPKAANAGKYTIYYKVIGDNNHNDSEIFTIEATINKADSIVEKIPVGKNLSYTGTEQELIQAGTTQTGTIEYSVNGKTFTTNIPKGLNTGEYTIYYKVIGDNNHNDSEVFTLKATINKVNSLVEVQPIGKTLKYTGKEQELIEPGTTSTGIIEYSVDGKTFTTNIPRGLNAGEYTIYYRVVGDDNHSDSEVATIVATISKITSTIDTKPQAKVLSYTGTEQELVQAGTTSTGIIEYSIDGKTFTTNIPKGLNARNYTVYYKVIGDNNHNNTEISSVIVTIAKVQSSFIQETSHKVVVFNGEEQEIIKAGSTNDGTILYSLDGVNFSDKIPTAMNVGKYKVYYRIVGDKNHLDSEIKSVESIITDLIGDINGDGKVNARDAKLVLQAFNGSVELTEEQKVKADVNGDGKINARDAKLILQIFNGK